MVFKSKCNFTKLGVLKYIQFVQPCFKISPLMHFLMHVMWLSGFIAGINILVFKSREMLKIYIKDCF